MRKHVRWTMVLTLLCSAITFGQDAIRDGCPLAAAVNGQSFTVRGKVTFGPHDMILDVPNCVESVVLVYAGDSGTNVSDDKLRQDKNLGRFKKYTEATYKGTRKHICLQCSKYEVEATLTGQLDIARIPQGVQRDPLGFLRDKSGKIVGKAGFGHPPSPYNYRLVIESVFEVSARHLPGPKMSDN